MNEIFKIIIVALFTVLIAGCKTLDGISESYAKATEYEIHEAIQEGNLANFLSVVKEQANQPASYPEGMTPLNRLLSSKVARNVQPEIRNQMFVQLVNNRSKWKEETYTRLVIYGTPQMIKAALTANLDINRKTPFETKTGTYSARYSGAHCPLVMHPLRKAGFGDLEDRGRVLANFRTLVENKADIHKTCTGDFYGGPNSGIAGKNVFDLLAGFIGIGSTFAEDAVESISILKAQGYYRDNFLRRAVERDKSKERANNIAKAQQRAREQQRRALEAEERRREQAESDRAWSVVLGTVNAQLQAQKAEQDRKKAQQDAITARINAQYYGDNDSSSSSDSSSGNSSSTNNTPSSSGSNNKPCNPDRQCRCQWHPQYSGAYDWSKSKGTVVCN